MAKWPLPPRGSPPLHGQGENKMSPTSGPGGYIKPAAWVVHTAAEWAAKAEVAHKWARWQHQPCYVGGPRGFREQNQEWPTSEPVGYISPAA